MINLYSGSQCVKAARRVEMAMMASTTGQMSPVSKRYDPKSSGYERFAMMRLKTESADHHALP
jgi:hypothetical protein